MAEGSAWVTTWRKRHRALPHGPICHTVAQRTEHRAPDGNGLEAVSAPRVIGSLVDDAAEHAEHAGDKLRALARVDLADGADPHGFQGFVVELAGVHLVLSHANRPHQIPCPTSAYL